MDHIEGCIEFGTSSLFHAQSWSLKQSQKHGTCYH